MFYLYTTPEKQRIIFAVISPRMVLRICVDAPKRKIRLNMPEINFIRFESFEENYSTPDHFHSGMIQSITMEYYNRLKADAEKKINDLIEKAVTRTPRKGSKKIVLPPGFKIEH